MAKVTLVSDAVRGLFVWLLITLFVYIAYCPDAWIKNNFTEKSQYIGERERERERRMVCYVLAILGREEEGCNGTWKRWPPMKTYRKPSGTSKSCSLYFIEIQSWLVKIIQPCPGQVLLWKTSLDWISMKYIEHDLGVPDGFLYVFIGGNLFHVPLQPSSSRPKIAST